MITGGKRQERQSHFSDPAFRFSSIPGLLTHPFPNPCKPNQPKPKKQHGGGFGEKSGLHDEVTPSVLRPALLVRLLANRAVFAVADRGDPVLRDTQIHEILRGVVRPVLTEGHVVLRGPAFIAVPLDYNLFILVL